MSVLGQNKKVFAPLRVTDAKKAATSAGKTIKGLRLSIGAPFLVFGLKT